MNAVRFLDTNILLYAYDLDAPAKRAASLRVVEQGWSAPGETAISAQVLQELHVNLARRGVSQADATQVVRGLAAGPVGWQMKHPCQRRRTSRSSTSAGKVPLRTPAIMDPACACDRTA